MPVDHVPLVPIDHVPVVPVDCVPLGPVDRVPLVPVDHVPVMPIDRVPVLPVLLDCDRLVVLVWLIPFDQDLPVTAVLLIPVLLVPVNAVDTLDTVASFDGSLPLGQLLYYNNP